LAAKERAIVVRSPATFEDVSVTQSQPIGAEDVVPHDCMSHEFDKDSPLRGDIRLLGRLLGDTIREQEGVDTFDLVERIRATSVRFHRDADDAARQELADILNELSPQQATRIVRAFSYFSHLANLAEDRHHIRRNRAHLLAGSRPRAGALPYAIARVIAANVKPQQLRGFFDSALISPVLTAHPTEVRRKSTITCEMAISDLLEQRDRRDLTEEEHSEIVDQLRRAVVTLWQTSLLRGTRLAVVDEVTNDRSAAA
jgi:phosphoenolpyruvate carboxylase